MAKQQAMRRNSIKGKKFNPALNAPFWYARKIAYLGDREWSIALSRCRGSSHLSNYTPCQDQVLKAELPDGMKAIALADGAGSSKFSHFGASLVVRQAVSLVCEQFDQMFAARGLEHFERWLIVNLVVELNILAKRGVPATNSDRARLQLPVKTREPLISCALKDLSSTLLLVAVKDNRYIAAHLGDGVIGMEEFHRDGTQRMRVLSKPDNGEFANVTKFVTSASAIDSLRIYRGRLDTNTKSVIGFILMSDGAESALYHKSTQTLAPACSKLIQACRDLPEQEMQVQLTATLRNVIATKTNDDCSISLLTRQVSAIHRQSSSVCAAMCQRHYGYGVL